MRINIRDIKVGYRVRRNPGNINALADSMRRLGQLQPILVDADNRLVCGYRRVEAARSLGWDTVDARQVDANTKEERLMIEAEENTTREDFTREELDKLDRLLNRYSNQGFFWHILNWLMDLMDRIFRR